MDHSVRSGSRLEVSVSFGRFDNDALAWEKWSSFSPNKYLEEVGSLSTPGSVAQKKAYFEAHYKKIAAQKAEAEEAEQDKLMDPESVSSKEDDAVYSPETCYKSGAPNGVKLIGEVEEEACLTVSSNEANSEASDNNKATFSGGDETGAGMTELMDAINLEEERMDGTPVVSYRSYVIEETEDELIVVDLPESNAGRDAELDSLETSRKDSQAIVEKSSGRKDNITQPGAIKKENSKLNTRNVAQKVTPTKKERNFSTMKRVASPATKPFQTSTPRNLKSAAVSTPISASQSLKDTPISASQSLKKKVNGSAQLKSKMTLVGENKRIPSTSFHMSLNTGPTNSLSSLSMTRKSLIMEKMGDKDIVKRAFKTFQTSVNLSSSAEKPSTVRHVLSTPVEPKISNFRTPLKTNERLKKDTDKGATPRSQPGARSNPLPAGSYKLSAPDKKSAMELSPLTGWKNDEKAEKRKEFLKKLEAKSIARVAENAQQIAKSKERCCYHPGSSGYFRKNAPSGKSNET